MKTEVGYLAVSSQSCKGRGLKWWKHPERGRIQDALGGGKRRKNTRSEGAFRTHSAGAKTHSARADTGTKSTLRLHAVGSWRRWTRMKALQVSKLWQLSWARPPPAPQDGLNWKLFRWGRLTESSSGEGGWQGSGKWGLDWKLRRLMSTKVLRSDSN